MSQPKQDEAQLNTGQNTTAQVPVGGTHITTAAPSAQASEGQARWEHKVVVVQGSQIVIRGHQNVANPYDLRKRAMRLDGALPEAINLLIDQLLDAPATITETDLAQIPVLSRMWFQEASAFLVALPPLSLAYKPNLASKSLAATYANSGNVQAVLKMLPLFGTHREQWFAFLRTSMQAEVLRAQVEEVAVTPAVMPAPVGAEEGEVSGTMREHGAIQTARFLTPVGRSLVQQGTTMAELEALPDSARYFTEQRVLVTAPPSVWGKPGEGNFAIKFHDMDVPSKVQSWMKACRATIRVTGGELGAKGTHVGDGLRRADGSAYKESDVRTVYVAARSIGDGMEQRWHVPTAFAATIIQEAVKYGVSPVDTFVSVPWRKDVISVRLLPSREARKPIVRGAVPSPVRDNLDDKYLEELSHPAAATLSAVERDTALGETGKLPCPLTWPQPRGLSAPVASQLRLAARLDTEEAELLLTMDYRRLYEMRDNYVIGKALSNVLALSTLGEDVETQTVTLRGPGGELSNQSRPPLVDKCNWVNPAIARIYQRHGLNCPDLASLIRRSWGYVNSLQIRLREDPDASADACTLAWVLFDSTRRLVGSMGLARGLFLSVNSGGAVLPLAPPVWTQASDQGFSPKMLSIAAKLIDLIHEFKADHTLPRDLPTTHYRLAGVAISSVASFIRHGKGLTLYTLYRFVKYATAPKAAKIDATQMLRRENEVYQEAVKRASTKKPAAALLIMSQARQHINEISAASAPGLSEYVRDSVETFLEEEGAKEWVVSSGLDLMDYLNRIGIHRQTAFAHAAAAYENLNEQDYDIEFHRKPLRVDQVTDIHYAVTSAGYVFEVSKSGGVFGWRFMPAKEEPIGIDFSFTRNGTRYGLRFHQLVKPLTGFLPIDVIARNAGYAVARFLEAKVTPTPVVVESAPTVDVEREVVEPASYRRSVNAQVHLFANSEGVWTDALRPIVCRPDQEFDVLAFATTDTTALWDGDDVAVTVGFSFGKAGQFFTWDRVPADLPTWVQNAIGNCALAWTPAFGVGEPPQFVDDRDGHRFGSRAPVTKGTSLLSFAKKVLRTAGDKLRKLTAKPKLAMALRAPSATPLPLSSSEDSLGSPQELVLSGTESDCSVESAVPQGRTRKTILFAVAASGKTTQICSKSSWVDGDVLFNSKMGKIPNYVTGYSVNVNGGRPNVSYDVSVRAGEGRAWFDTCLPELAIELDALRALCCLCFSERSAIHVHPSVIAWFNRHRFPPALVPLYDWLAEHFEVDFRVWRTPLQHLNRNRAAGLVDPKRARKSNFAVSEHPYSVMWRHLSAHRFARLEELTGDRLDLSFATFVAVGKFILCDLDGEPLHPSDERLRIAPASEPRGIYSYMTRVPHIDGLQLVSGENLRGTFGLDFPEHWEPFSMPLLSCYYVEGPTASLVTNWNQLPDERSQAGKNLDPSARRLPTDTTDRPRPHRLLLEHPDHGLALYRERKGLFYQWSLPEIDDEHRVMAQFRASGEYYRVGTYDAVYHIYRPRSCVNLIDVVFGLNGKGTLHYVPPTTDVLRYFDVMLVGWSDAPPRWESCPDAKVSKVAWWAHHILVPPLFLVNCLEPSRTSVTVGGVVEEAWKQAFGPFAPLMAVAVATCEIFHSDLPAYRALTYNQPVRQPFWSMALSRILKHVLFTVTGPIGILAHALNNAWASRLIPRLPKMRWKLSWPRPPEDLPPVDMCMPFKRGGRGGRGRGAHSGGGKAPSPDSSSEPVSRLARAPIDTDVYERHPNKSYFTLYRGEVHYSHRFEEFFTALEQRDSADVRTDDWMPGRTIWHANPADDADFKLTYLQVWTTMFIAKGSDGWASGCSLPSADEINRLLACNTVPRKLRDFVEHVHTYERAWRGAVKLVNNADYSMGMHTGRLCMPNLRRLKEVRAYRGDWAYAALLLESPPFRNTCIVVDVAEGAWSPDPMVWDAWHLPGGIEDNWRAVPPAQIYDGNKPVILYGPYASVRLDFLASATHYIRHHVWHANDVSDQVLAYVNTVSRNCQRTNDLALLTAVSATRGKPPKYNRLEYHNAGAYYKAERALPLAVDSTFSAAVSCTVAPTPASTANPPPGTAPPAAQAGPSGPAAAVVPALPAAAPQAPVAAVAPAPAHNRMASLDAILAFYFRPENATHPGEAPAKGDNRRKLPTAVYRGFHLFLTRTAGLSQASTVDLVLFSQARNNDFIDMVSTVFPNTRLIVWPHSTGFEACVHNLSTHAAMTDFSQYDLQADTVMFDDCVHYLTPAHWDHLGTRQLPHLAILSWARYLVSVNHTTSFLGDVNYQYKPDGLVRVGDGSTVLPVSYDRVCATGGVFRWGSTWNVAVHLMYRPGRVRGAVDREEGICLRNYVLTASAPLGVGRLSMVVACEELAAHGALTAGSTDEFVGALHDRYFVVRDVEHVNAALGYFALRPGEPLSSGRYVPSELVDSMRKMLMPHSRDLKAFKMACSAASRMGKGGHAELSADVLQAAVAVAFLDGDSTMQMINLVEHNQALLDRINAFWEGTSNRAGWAAPLLGLACGVTAAFSLSWGVALAGLVALGYTISQAADYIRHPSLSRLRTNPGLELRGVLSFCACAAASCLVTAMVMMPIRAMGEDPRDVTDATCGCGHTPEAGYACLDCWPYLNAPLMGEALCNEAFYADIPWPATDPTFKLESDIGATCGPKQGGCQIAPLGVCMTASGDYLVPTQFRSCAHNAVNAARRVCIPHPFNLETGVPYDRREATVYYRRARRLVHDVLVEKLNRDCYGRLSDRLGIVKLPAPRCTREEYIASFQGGGLWAAGLSDGTTRADVLDKTESEVWQPKTGSSNFIKLEVAMSGKPTKTIGGEKAVVTPVARGIQSQDPCAQVRWGPLFQTATRVAMEVFAPLDYYGNAQRLAFGFGSNGVDLGSWLEKTHHRMSSKRPGVPIKAFAPDGSKFEAHHSVPVFRELVFEVMAELVEMTQWELEELRREFNSSATFKHDSDRVFWAAMGRLMSGKGYTTWFNSITNLAVFLTSAAYAKHVAKNYHAQLRNELTTQSGSIGLSDYGVLFTGDDCYILTYSDESQFIVDFYARNKEAYEYQTGGVQPAWYDHRTFNYFCSGQEFEGPLTEWDLGGFCSGYFVPAIVDGQEQMVLVEMLGKFLSKSGYTVDLLPPDGRLSRAFEAMQSRSNYYQLMPLARHWVTETLERCAGAYQAKWADRRIWDLKWQNSAHNIQQSPSTFAHWERIYGDGFNSLELDALYEPGRMVYRSPLIDIAVTHDWERDGVHGPKHHLVYANTNTSSADLVPHRVSIGSKVRAVVCSLFVKISCVMRSVLGMLRPRSVMSAVGRTIADGNAVDHSTNTRMPPKQHAEGAHKGKKNNTSAKVERELGAAEKAVKAADKHVKEHFERRQRKGKPKETRPEPPRPKHPQSRAKTEPATLPAAKPRPPSKSKIPGPKRQGVASRGRDLDQLEKLTGTKPLDPSQEKVSVEAWLASFSLPAQDLADATRVYPPNGNSFIDVTTRKELEQFTWPSTLHQVGEYTAGSTLTPGQYEPIVVCHGKSTTSIMAMCPVRKISLVPLTGVGLPTVVIDTWGWDVEESLVAIQGDVYAGNPPTTPTGPSVMPITNGFIVPHFELWTGTFDPETGDFVLGGPYGGEKDTYILPWSSMKNSTAVYNNIPYMSQFAWMPIHPELGAGLLSTMVVPVGEAPMACCETVAGPGYVRLEIATQSNISANREGFRVPAGRSSFMGGTMPMVGMGTNIPQFFDGPNYVAWIEYLTALGPGDTPSTFAPVEWVPFGSATFNYHPLQQQVATPLIEAVTYEWTNSGTGSAVPPQANKWFTSVTGLRAATKFPSQPKQTQSGEMGVMVRALPETIENHAFRTFFDYTATAAELEASVAAAGAAFTRRAAKAVRGRRIPKTETPLDGLPHLDTMAELIAQVERFQEVFAAEEPAGFMGDVFNTNPVREDESALPMLAMATFMDTTQPLVVGETPTDPPLAAMSLRYTAASRVFLSLPPTSGLLLHPTVTCPSAGGLITTAALRAEFTVGPNSFGDWLRGAWNSFTDVASRAAEVAWDVAKTVAGEAAAVALLA